MNKLLIYSASAGSGKTHKLTGNVLQTLIKNVSDYKHILAVTFTRKASEEMKTRLLEELYALASNKKSDFLDLLIKQNGFSEALVRDRAQQALNNILHHYGRFSYSTIDSFFQSIHRGFLREANIHSNFELQLDTKQVAEHSVNMMLDDAGENPVLQEWILKLIDEELLENGKWEVRDKISSLFSEVFKESFEKIIPSSNQKTDISSQLEDLNKYCVKQINIIENGFKTIASKLLAICKRIDMQPEDFKYKNGSAASVIVKFPDNIKPLGKRIFSAAIDETTWVKPNSPEYTKSSSALPQLMALAQELIDLYQSKLQLYSTSKVVHSQIYYLGLVLDARNRVNKYLEENNEYLLSDVTRFLAALTVNNDAPFVYEKTGTYIRHYLIDEFQDTSNMQWMALKPLMEECLAHANNNGMIVGDVKQSIYRWRNGNWRLLGKEVPNQFGVTPLAMQDNYRSKSNIVTFNNSIFTNASVVLENFIVEKLNDEEHSELISDYEGLFSENYKNVIQNIKKDDGGWIKIKYYEGKKEEWQASSMENCMQIIEELQQKGTSPGDIAILVRTNDEGKRIANYILNYAGSKQAKEDVNYRIVSNEALMLISSPATKILSGIFYYISDNKQTDKLFEAAILYQKYYLHQADIVSILPISATEEQLLNLFPDGMKEFCNLASQYPVYELSERLIDFLGLQHDKDTIPFIEAFCDLCISFSGKNNADISSFIEWWNNNAYSQKLKLPEDPDAIRILSIHKSKGLGIEHVLIPFCNWDITPNANLSRIWCSTKEEPFNNFPAYPLKATKEVAKSYFYKDYYDEYFAETFDNLNILYVACTRAKTGLYIGGKKETKDSNKNTNTISKVLYSALNMQAKDIENTFNSFEEYKVDEENEYTIGEIDKQEYIKPTDTSVPHFPIHIPNKQLLAKNTSKYIENNEAIKLGLLFHSIFENIGHENDIEQAVNKAYAEGLIQEKQKKDIILEIKNKINKGIAANWFKGYKRLLAEQWLMLSDGSFKRPDRVVEYDDYWVVIDYKFGHKENNKYKTQVAEYMQVIGQICGKEVQGFVWYVMLNKIVEVNIKETKA